ncbi:ASCH domain-containing protein [Roseomonas elaeocarpi]|uniref:ASCH domain-containing protein n=1 Tax=Roseomonas elaeocarpi TaxID=907779 RepID=A0ABV6JNY9_9PROT
MTSALVVKEPYCNLILRGEKTLELRTSRLKKRGRILLVRKGSGLIVGAVELIGCIGPLQHSELLMLGARHKADPEVLLSNPQWNYCWELGNATSLRHPVRYRHPKGAQSWVTLDDQPQVLDEVNRQLLPAD